MELSDLLQYLTSLSKIAKDAGMSLQVGFPKGIQIVITATEPALEFARKRGIPTRDHQLYFNVRTAEEFPVFITRLQDVLHDLDTFQKTLQ